MRGGGFEVGAYKSLLVAKGLPGTQRAETHKHTSEMGEESNERLKEKRGGGGSHGILLSALETKRWLGGNHKPEGEPEGCRRSTSTRMATLIQPKTGVVLPRRTSTCFGRVEQPPVPPPAGRRAPSASATALAGSASCSPL